MKKLVLYKNELIRRRMKMILYKNCRSRWYLQLSSFKFFNLRTLSCSKNNIKFQHHNSACRIRKIIYFLYGVKWRYFLYQSCSSQWDLQLCSFEFFHLRTLRGSKNNIKFWRLPKIENRFWNQPRTKFVRFW